MSLLHLKIESITEADLQRLAEEGISESKTLEYKLVLEIATDDQKREGLSDVTALANTDGGDLIFGIRAEKGIAIDLPGLKNFVADDTIATMENLLRDFVQPRLFGARFHPVPLASGNTALVIRVPRSLNSPHMVRHKGVTCFCGRKLRPAFDQVWNACGLAGSPNYNEAGDWEPRN